jgi:type II secretory pathway predicted ATPase ExeA
MFKAIQDRLFHLFKEKKKPFLLILDEANELSSAILKDLKMLMNYDYDSLNCFTLVLAGELSQMSDNCPYPSNISILHKSSHHS